MTKYKLKMIGFSNRNESLFEYYFQDNQPQIQLSEVQADIVLIDLDTTNELTESQILSKCDNPIIIYLSIDPPKEKLNSYFLQKPLNIEELDRCFEAVLRKISSSISVSEQLEKLPLASEQLEATDLLDEKIRVKAEQAIIDQTLANLSTPIKVEEESIEPTQVIDGLCVQFALNK